MPTRLKRPSLSRRLAITAALVMAQVYLGYWALGGNYGLENQRAMRAELASLSAREQVLDVEIAAMQDRISLLDPRKLDPDLLTERARTLLGMAHPDDILIPVDEDGR